VAAVNPTGIIVFFAGAWVLCQVLGGNALARLKIVDPPEKQYIRKLPPTGQATPQGTTLGGALAGYAGGQVAL